MTTEPSLFWVDPGELSLLLREAGVSSAPESPLPGLTAAAPDAASGRRDGGKDGASRPAFVKPKGSFEERLQALLDWIRPVTDFDYAFVVDQEGLALVHESAPLELIAASAAMSELWESLRNRFDLSPKSYLALDLGRGGHLHLLAANSPWGHLSLGFVAGDPVSGQDIAAIHEQFLCTLEEEGAS